MDPERLRQRLTRARLMLGPVEHTIDPFIASIPAPVAFISFDLDYYSSTVAALRLFDAPATTLLPRVHCYFDDIIGVTYSEFTGERLAINEFNQTHDARKISPIFGLRYLLHPAHREWPWVEQMFLAHLFDHDLYNQPDGLQLRHAGGHTTLEDASRQRRDSRV